MDARQRFRWAVGVGVGAVSLATAARACLDVGIRPAVVDAAPATTAPAVVALPEAAPAGRPSPPTALPADVRLALRPPAPPAGVPGAVDAPVAVIAPWTFGASGAVRMLALLPDAAAALAPLHRAYGEAARRPGAYPLMDRATGAILTVLVLRPFAEKRGGWVGPYRLGTWPGEGAWPWDRLRPALPPGFIEVTPASAEVPVSIHFRLGAFLTHDQPAVWPKYVVLQERLLDKLELVLAELARRGVDVRRPVILSGFRTPAYNALGVGAGGRARESRHQYGDAADLYLDADADGWMDDLTGDGRVDVRDAAVVAAAAEAVERAHPALVGGVGLYPAAEGHGPFVHVDARGRRARW